MAIETHSGFTKQETSLESGSGREKIGIGPALMPPATAYSDMLLQKGTIGSRLSMNPMRAVTKSIPVNTNLALKTTLHFLSCTRH